MSDLLCLQIPADFERLPEFRILVGELSKVQSPKSKVHDGDSGDGVPTGRKVEAVANFLWMRLWVELAYLAQTTNRPGYLTSQGAELFRRTVDPLFGEDCDPVDLLVKAGVLKALEDRLLTSAATASAATDAGWFCAHFARLNAHTSGDYVSREVRGANHSALVRNQQRIAADAAVQASLLPSEIFRKGDGTELNPTEVQKVTVLIKTVDNCLKRPNRPSSRYSAGLIADAAAVMEKRDATVLREVYLWISNHRDNPALPRTTEQVLREWESVELMAGVRE